VVTAIDHNEFADDVYRLNFPHPTRRWNIVGIKHDQLAPLAAELWWMSPPCQPFTVRGRRGDIDDPRCAALLHLLELLETIRPRHLGFENVPGFQRSRAHAQLIQTLERCGYHWQERLLCHSAMGVPNRRARYYLLASQDPLTPWSPPEHEERPLSGYLDLEPDPSLYVSPDLLERYKHALPITVLDSPAPTTFCYTSAYGRSPVHSGSYLRDDVGVRLLSPSEILRLHHFPAGFELPPKMSRRRAYQLVGNSLAVLAVREVLHPLGISAR